MKNSIGNTVSVTLFGESHGPFIGAVLDGLAPGIPVDEAFIAAQLEKRRPKDALSTQRREADAFTVCSGVFAGKTTGTPLCIIIPNESTKSADYEALHNVARPGHADYTAYCKYHGFADYRGGGHFSGRVTAALVAVGAIALSALAQKGILIGTHIAQCGACHDRPFSDLVSDVQSLSQRAFPTLCEEAEQEMRAEILRVKSQGDSIGGIVETAVIGLPAGVGEPWFDGVESVLSHYLFSVPAIKAVEFGLGFDFANKQGSEANDAFCIQDGRVVTATNHNGGINGGITNGMPLVFRCAVKPTPSIYQTQKTVDFVEKKDTELLLTGRHDPCILQRVPTVMDSVVALALCDLLTTRYGTDYLAFNEVKVK